MAWHVADVNLSQQPSLVPTQNRQEPENGGEPTMIRRDDLHFVSTRRKKKILKLFWSIIIAIVTHCVGFLMLFPRRFREIFRLDWCHCWCLFSDVEWGRKMCSKVSIGMLECRRLLFAFHTLATSSEWFIESGTIRVCWQRKDPLVRVFVIVSLSSLFRPKLSLLIFVYENSVTISGVVVVCTSIFTQCCGCDSFFFLSNEKLGH